MWWEFVQGNQAANAQRQNRRKDSFAAGNSRVRLERFAQT
jgi:hypothetical protein